jgi:hypothetical protein
MVAVTQYLYYVKSVVMRAQTRNLTIDMIVVGSKRESLSYEGIEKVFLTTVAKNDGEMGGKILLFFLPRHLSELKLRRYFLGSGFVLENIYLSILIL